MGSVGFKEWAVVCEALGGGEQTVLLRKGGIAEGREGFGFRHPEFFLFPTFFHEQSVKVRGAATAVPEPVKGAISVDYFAKVEAQKNLMAWSQVRALEPFHILAEAVVRERFEYKGAGLAVALVRVYRLEPGWVCPERPAYGGCRSWVNLPECPPGTRFEPVLGDQEFRCVAERFRAATS